MKRNRFSLTKLMSCVLFSVVVFVGCIGSIKERITRGDERTCISDACHNDFLLKKYVHLPIKNGECLNCHVPLTKMHPNEDMLDFEADGALLCFECHDEMQKKLETSIFLHEPFKEGVCIMCHEIHSSDYEKSLKTSPEEICHLCHKEFINMGDDLNIHALDKLYSCLDCHDPHATDKDMLLIK